CGVSAGRQGGAAAGRGPHAAVQGGRGVTSLAETGAVGRLSLRRRLAVAGFDGTTLLLLPGLIVIFALFVYPFLFGLYDSLVPKQGAWYANYQKFFSDPFEYNTIWATLWLAVPVTIVNLLLAIPVAFRVRLMRRQRLL